MSRVLKWVVPVDDQRHEIGGGPIVHVGHQGSVNEVVVWTDEPEGDRPPRVQAQVYGTGHKFPDEGLAIGSVVHLPPAVLQIPGEAPRGIQSPLVWHLVVFP